MDINNRIENLLSGILKRIDLIANKTNTTNKPVKMWKLSDGYGNKLIFFFFGTLFSLLISIFIISPYSTQLTYLNTAKISNINYSISRTSVFQPPYKKDETRIFTEKDDFVNPTIAIVDLKFTFDVVVKSGTVNRAYLIYPHHQTNTDYVFNEKDFHAITSIKTESNTNIFWFLNQNENKSISDSKVKADINYTQIPSSKKTTDKIVYLAIIDQNNNINISLLSISNVTPQILADKSAGNSFRINKFILEDEWTTPKYKFLIRSQILDNQDTYNQFDKEKKITDSYFCLFEEYSTHH